MTPMVERPAQRGRRAAYAVPAACWLLAVGVLLVSVLMQRVDPSAARGVPELDELAWWGSAAVLTAQAAVLARWGGTHPRAALLGVAAGVPALANLGDAVGAALVTVLVASFVAVVARPARPLVPTLVGAGVLVAVGVAAAQLVNGGSWTTAVVVGPLQGLAAVGLPFALASVVAARADAATALAATAQAQRRARDALVQVAVERERTAMARELHDIAAHHLTGITVMTAAIGRQIDVDPDGAKRAVAQVREQSKAMLGDLRNLVALLRDTETDAAAGPAGPVRMETLAGIGELVARARESGLDVTLDTSGPVDTLAASGAVGPLAQLAAYRVVQEALANVGRHAPGARCTVRVDAEPGDRLELAVTNDAPPDGGTPAGHGRGYGLVGMRERAELTGATLQHGPTPDGGWRVALTVPVEPAAPTSVEETR